jgi:hypothetical protein
MGGEGKKTRFEVRRDFPRTKSRLSPNPLHRVVFPEFSSAAVGASNGRKIEAAFRRANDGPAERGLRNSTFFFVFGTTRRLPAQKLSPDEFTTN